MHRLDPVVRLAAVAISAVSLAAAYLVAVAGPDLSALLRPVSAVVALLLLGQSLLFAVVAYDRRGRRG